MVINVKTPKVLNVLTSCWIPMQMPSPFFLLYFSPSFTLWILHWASSHTTSLKKNSSWRLINFKKQIKLLKIQIGIWNKSNIEQKVPKTSSFIWTDAKNREEDWNKNKGDPGKCDENNRRDRINFSDKRNFSRKNRKFVVKWNLRKIGGKDVFGERVFLNSFNSIYKLRLLYIQLERGENIQKRINQKTHRPLLNKHRSIFAERIIFGFWI